MGVTEESWHGVVDVPGGEMLLFQDLISGRVRDIWREELFLANDKCANPLVTRWMSARSIPVLQDPLQVVVSGNAQTSRLTVLLARDAEDPCPVTVVPGLFFDFEDPMSGLQQQDDEVCLFRGQLPRQERKGLIIIE